MTRGDRFAEPLTTEPGPVKAPVVAWDTNLVAAPDTVEPCPVKAPLVAWVAPPRGTVGSDSTISFGFVSP